MDWNQIWETIKSFFLDNGWNILKFVAILIFGLIAIKVILNVTRRLMSKTHMEKIALQFLMGAIKLVLYLVWVLMLLSTIGVEITGIITALSALLLAVGMALQNNISNLANGIIIVVTKMFKKGDYIIVDGEEGSITDINFLFTTIITTDNKKVTIPNSTIVNSSVVNAGANPKRRVNFTFSVAYETDVELVKKIVKDVMISNGCVDLDPAPFCRLKTLGASSIDFFANCWCDSEDYWDVYYYVVENVYNEFKRHNISIPYNQLEIRNRVDEVSMPYNEVALPERVEKERHNKKAFDLETADLTKMFKRKSKKSSKSKNDSKNKEKVKKENKKSEE